MDKQAESQLECWERKATEKRSRAYMRWGIFFVIKDIGEISGIWELLFKRVTVFASELSWST